MTLKFLFCVSVLSVVVCIVVLLNSLHPSNNGPSVSSNAIVSKGISDMKKRNMDIFLPGNSGLSRKETWNKCYVDPVKYQRHFRNVSCTVSEKYKIVFFLIPKSGSSSSRHILKNHFSGIDHGSCGRYLSDPTYRKITSLRNPLSRFYSSYDEMVARRLEKQDTIPKQYRQFMVDLNVTNYKEYSSMFDSDHGVDILTDSFETFVKDYDGRRVFDAHIALQTPFLSNRNTGMMYEIDDVFDTHELDIEFNRLASDVGIDSLESFKGRSYPRRFSISSLHGETIRKICHLSANDFCCTNTPLPPECLNYNLKTGHRIGCKHDEAGIHSVIY